MNLVQLVFRSLLSRPHRTRSFAAALISALMTGALLTSCMSGTREVRSPTSVSQTPAPPSSSRSVVADPLIPDTSAWVAKLPAAPAGKRLTAAAASKGLSMPWKFLKFDGGRDRVQIVYLAGDGSCVMPEGFYVAPVARGFLLTAVSIPVSSTAKACGSGAVVQRAIIQLSAPIQSGTALLHAPVSAPWSQGHYLD